jgi:16S rRNA processing protein RimM
VWVIKSPGGKEILIPYIEDVVKKVDVKEKVILIEPMEGLLS